MKDDLIVMENLQILQTSISNQAIACKIVNDRKWKHNTLNGGNYRIDLHLYYQHPWFIELSVKHVIVQVFCFN